jgi:anti-anti-sigma factor
MWRLFSRQPSSTGQDGAAGDSAPASRSFHHAIGDVEVIDGAAVATITTEELAGETGIESMADLLAGMRGTGAKHFVLDLQNVGHMDSGCVGTLVEALNHLVARGGKLALVNPDRSVAYLFKLTRLDRIFPICANVMAALAVVNRD